MEKTNSMHLKKKEFSKLILIVAAVINLIVIGFTILMVWKTLDLSPLLYLIPSTAAEVTAGTAYYYSKAKAENEIKLKAIYEERNIYHE